MKFGENLKELREEKKLSQRQLAEKVSLTPSAIAKWELSKVDPSASAVVILAQFFNVTVGQLLGVEEY